MNKKNLFLSIMLGITGTLAAQNVPIESAEGGSSNIKNNFSFQKNNIVNSSVKRRDTASQPLILNATSAITAGQYCQFLNAVAKDDTHHLYDSEIEEDNTVATIIRSGAPGNYSYSVTSGEEDFLVSYVNLEAALRFCNWLENNQPIGEQGPVTTEQGVYTLGDLTGDTSKNQEIALPITPASNSRYYLSVDEIAHFYGNDISSSKVGFCVATKSTLLSLTPLISKTSAGLENSLIEDAAAIATSIMVAGLVIEGGRVGGEGIATRNSFPARLAETRTSNIRTIPINRVTSTEGDLSLQSAVDQQASTLANIATSTYPISTISTQFMANAAQKIAWASRPGTILRAAPFIGAALARGMMLPSEEVRGFKAINDVREINLGKNLLSMPKFSLRENRMQQIFSFMPQANFLIGRLRPSLCLSDARTAKAVMSREMTKAINSSKRMAVNMLMGLNPVAYAEGAEDSKEVSNAPSDANFLEKKQQQPKERTWWGWFQGEPAPSHQR
ncbi:MAG: hypothetical protein ACH346_06100, partial [Chthoniobacterales bacterium]